MTRALLTWFGRRRVLVLGGLLLAVAAGGWALRRTCDRCPRAAEKIAATVPTAADGPPVVSSAHPDDPVAGAQPPIDKPKPKAKRKQRGPWMAQCEQRLLAARSELIRHDPIFGDGVVEVLSDDHVRYALGWEDGLDSCLQPARFCNACATVDAPGVYGLDRLGTYDWGPVGGIPRSARLMRGVPGRVAFLDPPFEGPKRKVFERVMKRALDDCLAMKDPPR